MSADKAQLDSRWPHRLAMLLVCATFPLIWVGGLVTTTRAGMAVPDWPGTYGYNLFLYPWQTWLFGPFDIFVEHGHRLLGALVGLLTIALLVVIWKKETRRWVQYLALGALALVCFQGFLGGMRVRMNAQQLALIHGCTAPLFFAVAIALAVVTSPFWRQERTTERPRGVCSLGIMSLPVVYLQLVLGAHIRHVPVDASPIYFQRVVFFHLIIVFVLLLHIAPFCFRALRTERSHRLRSTGGLLGLAMCLQLILGPMTWVMRYGWPSWLSESAGRAAFTVEAQGFVPSLVVTTHQAMGSLILALCLLLTLRAGRIQWCTRQQSHPISNSPQSTSKEILQMGVVA